MKHRLTANLMHFLIELYIGTSHYQKRTNRESVGKKTAVVFDEKGGGPGMFCDVLVASFFFFLLTPTSTG